MITRAGLIPVFLLLSVLMPQAVWAGDFGTKEEAVAMVKRAVTLLMVGGSQNAIAQINNPGYRFAEKDLYVTVHNMKGKCLADAVDPTMVGKNLDTLRDEGGKQLIRDRIKMARRQLAGWQSYESLDRATGKFVPRAAYFQRAGDFIVSCGIHVRETPEKGVQTRSGSSDGSRETTGKGSQRSSRSELPSQD